MNLFFQGKIIAFEHDEGISTTSDIDVISSPTRPAEQSPATQSWGSGLLRMFTNRSTPVKKQYLEDGDQKSDYAMSENLPLLDDQNTYKRKWCLYSEWSIVL